MMVFRHCRACLSCNIRRLLLTDGYFGHFTNVHHSWLAGSQFILSTSPSRRDYWSTARYNHRLEHGNNMLALHEHPFLSYIPNRCIGNVHLDEYPQRKPDKGVGITTEDQQNIVKLSPTQPEDPRILKVSIIGAPNAGKSSLINNIIGWRIASVSAKVHTTRSNAVGILSEDNTQVIFLDTPGLITPDKLTKHKLERTLLRDPYSSLFEADLIVAVIDASKPWNRSRLDKDVLTALTLHPDKKSILVMNKVDLLKCKSDLLTAARLLTEGMVGGKPSPHYKISKTDDEIDILEEIMMKEKKLTETANDDSDEIKDDTTICQPLMKPDNEGTWWSSYSKKLKRTKAEVKDKRGWEKFDSIFMISALHNDGVDDVKNYLITNAQPGHWQYHDSVLTDQDPVDIAKLCVREKLLDHLPKEIPYGITIDVVTWEYDENNFMSASIDLICDRSRDVAHVIGPNGAVINTIRDEVKQSMMNTFKQELGLQLSVRKKSE